MRCVSVNTDHASELCSSVHVVLVVLVHADVATDADADVAADNDAMALLRISCAVIFAQVFRSASLAHRFRVDHCSEAHGSHVRQDLSMKNTFFKFIHLSYLLTVLWS